jgi:hypothetical protein
MSSLHRTDHTLSELQKNIPWGNPYSDQFQESRLPHKDFAHALTHVAKACGKLHAVVDEFDHHGVHSGLSEHDSQTTVTVANSLADLVICALRAANTYPGGLINLQEAVKSRIEDKMDVKLAKPLDVPACHLEDLYLEATGQSVNEQTSISEIMTRIMSGLHTTY